MTITEWIAIERKGLNGEPVARALMVGFRDALDLLEVAHAAAEAAEKMALEIREWNESMESVIGAQPEWRLKGNWRNTTESVSAYRKKIEEILGTEREYSGR